ncbi:hypothetical protein FHG87_003485 [Trinorchestia longiramus]|nr:hypothetical protein FHG87_003485 [Trinorchestia longiramus]
MLFISLQGLDEQQFASLFYEQFLVRRHIVVGGILFLRLVFSTNFQVVHKLSRRRVSSHGEGSYWLDFSVSQSGPYRPPGGVEEMQGGGRRVRLE